MAKAPVLEEGRFSFTVESRILRELGERLVKQPDVALLELIKNAYDADASLCTIEFDRKQYLRISDNGLGMTLDRFRDGWMRIGTSSKEDVIFSPRFDRLITGEKGIGRFSVRFLGKALALSSVAYDQKRKKHTRLTAKFDWPQFDLNEDLGRVGVPYRLEEARANEPTGTTLTISDLRSETNRLDFSRVRTGSLGIISPLRSLFAAVAKDKSKAGASDADPGFQLTILHDPEAGEEEDVASTILDHFILRAIVRLEGNKLHLDVYRREDEDAFISVVDTYRNDIQRLNADIRFFPTRTGTFTGLPVDGRSARKWLSENCGVAIFDRNFRVLPYGMQGDDWLMLQADSTRNERNPRAVISEKHFPMSAKVKSDPAQNWMLRLPANHQVVGVVQVEGRRTTTSVDDSRGLIASADREGFLDNEAFGQLFQIVRGAVEAIAFADRKIQLQEMAAERRREIASLRKETKEAISDVQKNPNIAAADKAKIVSVLAKQQEINEAQDRSARERERQLEVMSLLGVVAGFMTHEFGAALKELEDTQKELMALVKSHPKLAAGAEALAEHIKSLREFVTYSSGYIQGSKITPEKAYPVKPRLQQVKRVFGKYADERDISVEITADPDLLAPLVPASLYNGIALNLYTNALKAVVAHAGKQQGRIAMRAWSDDRWHYLEVSDNGIGIPSTLHERVFDPLFTTTDSNRDPLGSGMGLGLALVRRGAEAFGGRAEIVDAPPSFSTCVRVRLPI